MMKKRFSISFLNPLLAAALPACAAVASTLTSEPTATSTPDPVTQGHHVFVGVCAQCHGENAEGYANELNAPALDSTEHAFHHPDQQIHDWIVNGKLGVGRQRPSLEDQLADREVHAIIRLPAYALDKRAINVLARCDLSLSGNTRANMDTSAMTFSTM
jgi:mono/diheme cytochrome c family protein